MPFEGGHLFTKMLTKLKSMLKLKRDFKQKTFWTVRFTELEQGGGSEAVAGRGLFPPCQRN